MSEIILDPECNGETFHTRDFLMFNKIRKQYQNDLKTDKIPTLNYTKNFFKKYIMGNELFTKMTRINKIIKEKLYNECKSNIEIAENKGYFSIDNYQFNTNCLDVDLNEVYDSSYYSGQPPKLDFEERNFGLSTSFKYHTIIDNYDNRIYHLFRLTPTFEINFLFSHYNGDSSNNDTYQYLYILSKTRDHDDINTSAIILYYKPTSYIIDDKEKLWSDLFEYSNLRNHSIFDEVFLLNQFTFIKCDKPIFDDYSLPLLRFYRWAKRKQYEISCSNRDDYSVIVSFETLFDKWCATNNIIKDDESKKEFLDEFFMYDKNFFNKYKRNITNELSTQWYTQILFSIVIDILEKSVPNFISGRDNLYSKSNSDFSRSNEVMIIDHIINEFKETFKNK